MKTLLLSLLLVIAPFRLAWAPPVEAQYLVRMTYVADLHGVIFANDEDCQITAEMIRKDLPELEQFERHVTCAVVGGR